MHELTELIRQDMRPALGVTEPGAIAFAVARARSCAPGEIRHILVELNSGMYKNAFTCGIPNSDRVGNVHAAALGAVAGRWEKELEALDGVTAQDDEAARALVESGRVKVTLSGISSDIFIRAAVETDGHSAAVTIRHSHTNIVRLEADGQVLLDRDPEAGAEDAAGGTPLIHRYTLAQLVDYAKTVPARELEFLHQAYMVNLALFQEGLDSPRTTFARRLLDMNHGQVISADEVSTAQLLCGAAIEARVIGLNKPAMSLTGSGAHGIIATLPLYASCRVRGLSAESLLRATALSALVCMYIKEYSGRLSAFCGCAIAAGTGMACGLALLRGCGLSVIGHTLNNMASSITGMICDGGNQGCTMKAIAATDAAFRSAALAQAGAYIDSVHGINGAAPEDTMRQMGLIASPGMTGTEKTIIEILNSKQP